MIKLRLLLFVIIIMNNSSCSQNPNKKQYNPDIMIKEVEQKVKSFKTQPYYSISFSNTNSSCQFEILVNDVPVFSKIGTKGGVNTSAPINIFILKSGKQKVKIKLYPRVGKDIITVGYAENTPFSLKVEVGKPNENGFIIDDVTIYELPFIILPKEGIPYFEQEFEFEAEVPYEFIGWSKSKDLTKIDNIEQKVLNKYKELQKLLENKDYSSFAEISSKKETEINTSFYFKSKNIIERYKEIEEAFKEKDAEVESLDNTKVVFYGNGKLVTLENLQDKSSALRTKINYIENDEKSEGKISFPIMLHIPEGSDELEIIR